MFLTGCDCTTAYPLLSSDVFQHFKCQMNYHTRPLVVGHIELIERYRKTFLCDDKLAEPRTEQIIEAKLENGFEHNTSESKS